MEKKSIVLLVIATVLTAAVGGAAAFIEYHHGKGPESNYTLLNDLDSNLREGLTVKSSIVKEDADGRLSESIRFEIEDADRWEFDYTSTTTTEYRGFRTTAVAAMIRDILGFDVTDEMEWPSRYSIALTESGTVKTYTVASKPGSRDCDVDLTLSYDGSSCIAADGEAETRRMQGGETIRWNVDIDTEGARIEIDGRCVRTVEGDDVTRDRIEDEIESILLRVDGASADVLTAMESDMDGVRMDSERFGNAWCDTYTLIRDIVCSGDVITEAKATSMTDPR